MNKFFIVLVLVFIVVISGCAGKQSKTPVEGEQSIQPPLNRSCEVKDITKIIRGTSPDWSWDDRLIAYQEEIGGSYEVFLTNPDGSGSRCLTCGGKLPVEFEGKHKGKATFYPPDSRYLLFSVENEYGDHSLATIPGIGDNHDLWITNLEDGTYWRLTQVPKDSAIQYPRFSSDGKKLLWSQRYEKERGAIFKKGREFGYWAMKMADFVISSDGPKLENITDMEPGGRGYYEPHGFSPDDQKIIMTAMLDPTRSQFYGEIYTLNLTSNELTRIARDEDVHYEMALYSPSGKKIAFMSGPFLGLLSLGYETDLYIMDADGSNRVRLTHFNELGHSQYQGSGQIDKLTWSRDGSKIVLGYWNRDAKERNIFVVTFNGPCGKL